MATTRTVRTPGATAQARQADTDASEVMPAAGDGGKALPNAVDVDPRALRAPVLTKQGYVCPDEDWQKKHPAEFQALLDAEA